MFRNQPPLTYIEMIRISKRRRILPKNSTSSNFATKHEVVPCPCMIRPSVTIRVYCATKFTSNQHSDLVRNSHCFYLCPKVSNCVVERRKPCLQVVFQVKVTIISTLLNMENITINTNATLIANLNKPCYLLQTA